MTYNRVRVLKELKIPRSCVEHPPAGTNEVLLVLVLQYKVFVNSRINQSAVSCVCRSSSLSTSDLLGQRGRVYSSELWAFIRLKVIFYAYKIGQDLQWQVITFRLME